MSGKSMNRPSVIAVSIMTLTLFSCAPEPSTQVYPQEVVGLEVPRNWSNQNWAANLPLGWYVEPVFGMRDASFRVVGDAGIEAEVSISRLPIQGGTLASNVNRWRVQAGLEPWAENEVVEKLTVISISDHEVYRMEFVGSSDSDQSIYGIMMEEGEQRTFIKFSGPKALMEKQLDAWNTFVKSLEIRHAH